MPLNDACNVSSLVIIVKKIACSTLFIKVNPNLVVPALRELGFRCDKQERMALTCLLPPRHSIVPAAAVLQLQTPDTAWPVLAFH